MAGVSITAIRPVRSDPGDIFAISAPAIGTPVPKAAEIAAGDASVSTQTGALSFSFPIKTPPGRNGMQPQLGLGYLSQAPIYGGIAAGWSLSGLHVISQDTSNGRIAGPMRFQSSMAGDRPLVEVNDIGSSEEVVATYRAKNDSSWTRYEGLGENATDAKWRAFTTDGTVWYFGESGHGTCSFSPSYAPLTRAVDKFGNAVDYFYEDSGPGSRCLIDHINWGHNEDAGIPHFATVKFDWAEMPLCVSGAITGSQTSWRTGTRIDTGTARLDKIRIAAFAPGAVTPPAVLPATPDHMRQITLAYYDNGTGSSSTEHCTTTHAPFRALRSIQESAWGVDSPQVNLPPKTFTYGNARFGTGELYWPAQPVNTTLNRPGFPGGS